MNATHAKPPRLGKEHESDEQLEGFFCLLTRIIEVVTSNLFKASLF